MQCFLSASSHMQVVIARVISIDHDALRMRLSLAPKTGNPAAEAAAGDPAGGLQPGDIVDGVIASITSKEVCSLAASSGHVPPRSPYLPWIHTPSWQCCDRVLTLPALSCVLSLPLRSPAHVQVGVERLPGSLMLTITTAMGATAQGRMEAEHLADHPTAVRELQEAVAVGAKLGPLLVLERLEVC